MKIEEMTAVFLNSANFASHAFLILAPPSRYALNLKSLINVSKVSWTSQLLYEILRCWVAMRFPVRRTHVRTSKIVSHALAHAPRFLGDRTRTRTFHYNFFYTSSIFSSQKVHFILYNTKFSKYDHLVRPSGMTVWYDRLIWPSGTTFWMTIWSRTPIPRHDS